MSWNKAAEAEVEVEAVRTTPTTHAAGSGFRRGRLIAAASLVAVASLALTACGQGEDDNTQASTKVSSSPLPAEPSDDAASDGNTADKPGSKDGAAEDPKKSEPGKSGGTNGGASGGGSTSGSGSASRGKGVNATVNGVLKYLAPGKLTVTPDAGTEQAFFIGPQTKTLGAAAICASNGNVTIDSSSYGTSPCTEAQLEKAAKMSSIEVKVTIKGGVATKIVEHYRS
ncbi:hypothetical protein TPA0598_03_05530 [Streptomyces lydicamycinicus]|uniref:Lipoprotein n=1 Tax=Streptomyces lydicamycinicus TaxID=1546107 RepID=A0A0P4R519_9ACTN|nr:hypothetical protein [Streptomyces lydicamycinicus]GAO08092.1 hypothetical protein TPA0598_03_05530 [Streptomyces lydicamycinicus]